MLPVGPEKPSDSASLIAWRSMAMLVASRTRRSAHGEPAVPCSGNMSQNTPLVRTAVSVSPGARRTSSAIGPLRKYTTSISPRLSAAARVDSSGMLRSTRRFTLGVLRQY